MFLGVLLGVFVLVILVDDRNQGTSAIVYFPEPRDHVAKDPLIFHCDDFSSDVRLHKNISIDAEVGKIYAAFLTKYDPPFWISQHADDKEIVNTGQNLREMEQTILMEQILREAHGGDVLFFQPNDWGWFSLLAASKPGRKVRIYHPQNRTNIIRLCESILLNQWHLDMSDANSLQENGVKSPRMQIITGKNYPLQSLGIHIPSQIALLKLQGDNLLATTVQDKVVSTVLRKGLAEYIWVEYRSGTSHGGSKDELEAILESISHSGDYHPHWPEASSDAWSSGQRRLCHSPCHFWWKRKLTTKP